MSKERMKQQKEDTLRKILDQAWQIAIQEGLEAISMRKLASAMNFATNNLYNYFENKNELLFYLKKDAYQWAIDIIQNNLHETDSVCVLFKQLSEQLLHCALEAPEKYIVMTSDVIMDNKEPLDQQITDLTAAKIREGIASGELKDIDPVMTAVNIRTLQIGFVRMISADKTMDTKKAYEMHDNLMDIIFEGIRRNG